MKDISVKEGNGYSLRRQWEFMRRYLATNGRTMMFWGGVMLGIMLAFSIIGSVSNADIYARLSPDRDWDPRWESEIWLGLVLLMVGAAWTGSMFYGSFGSKEGRLDMLTLPVRGSEKFWSWFVLYVPTLLVFMFLAILFTDFVRVEVMRIFLGLGDSVKHIPVWAVLGYRIDLTPALVAEGAGSITGDAGMMMMSVQFYGIALMVQALFALGSIYVPKHPLVKTAVALIALQFMAGLLFAGGVKLFFGDNWTGRYPDSAMTMGSVWEAALTMAVVAGLIYWLSYARMKETEIVNRW